MRNFENIQNFYFLGIGGIGMSAIARFANALDKNVAGYDLTQTELTLELEAENIQIHYTDSIELIPVHFTPHNTLVVVTPAVPQSLNEFQYLKKQGFNFLKRSEMLGLLTQNSDCVAVAGTHGKTSVSTMIAFLLHQSNIDAGAFLGGISRNFNSNLVLPPSPQSLVVTEADEYDRSFLHLHPSLAVVTSIDPDHLDIYQNFANITDAFEQFVANTKDKGILLLNKKVSTLIKVPENVSTYYYSIDDTEAHFFASNIRISDNKFHFDFHAPEIEIKDVCMSYPGRVNLENMIAAMAVAIIQGATPQNIKKSVSEYKGVVRRFDVQFQANDVVYIDDYAHHPSELEATIKSIRELYQNRKITGVFQPHLFSRTNDFALQFAQSLDLLDEVILLDIYPAREKPIEGVTSDIIFNKISNPNKTKVQLNGVIQLLQNRNIEVLLTLGAGNIDTLVSPITQFFRSKY